MEELKMKYLERLSELVSHNCQCFYRDHQSAGNPAPAKSDRAFSD